jgi:hypothetical protein
MSRERGARLADGEAFAELHMAREDAGAMARAARCFEVADVAPAPRAEDLVLERVKG